VSRILRFSPLLLLIAIFALLEIGSRTGMIPLYILPSPSSLFETFFTERFELSSAFGQTMLSAALALVAASAIGLTLGFLLSVSPLIHRAFMPYITFFQTVPIVAIAPLLVIWFGYGRSTVVASGIIVCIFPIIANTMLGFSATEPAALDLFKIYRSSSWQTLRRLRIPSALPQILGGLRIASGLAVVGTIVGEFIAGGGLGALVDSARTQQRIDLVFCAVLLAAILGGILVSAISILEYFFLSPWHSSKRPMI
jgi:NitT/TauT family transport system permease protein